MGCSLYLKEAQGSAISIRPVIVAFLSVSGTVDLREKGGLQQSKIGTKIEARYYVLHASAFSILY